MSVQPKPRIHLLTNISTSTVASARKRDEQGSPAIDHAAGNGASYCTEVCTSSFTLQHVRFLGAIINCLSGLFLASVIHAFVDWSLLSEELDGLVIDAISVLVATVILAVSFTTDASASLDMWDALSEHMAVERKFK